MKRRWWLLFAGVTAKAQNKDDSIMNVTSNCVYDASGRLVTPGCQNVSEENGVKTYHPVQSRINVTPKPLNGECPVCHEMAPKYVRRTTSYAMGAYDPEWLLDQKSTEARSYSSEWTYTPWIKSDHKPMIVTWGNRYRRIDCDHCGNTFRQFAEDVRP